VHVQVNSGPLIQPVSESDIAMVLRKDQTSGVKLEYNVPPLVNGPVASGAPLGQIIVLDGGEVMTKVDAICPVTIGQAPSQINSVTVNVANEHNVIMPTAPAIPAVGVSLSPAQVNR
jgi:hypothetical protein